MKESVMSIEKPIFNSRVNVVKKNSSATDSNGDIVVSSKYRRGVLEANIIGRETGRSQSAESLTQTGARFFIFRNV